MKISTKGRYGLKAMIDIAVYSQGNYLSLKSVAKRQNISDNYLEQLFSSLKKAGLLKSNRGAYGGYTLAALPQDITVGDILRALEGPLSPVDCINTQEEYKCESWDLCVTKIVWQKMTDNMNELLDSISLNDLVQQHKNIIQKSNVY